MNSDNNDSSGWISVYDEERLNLNWLTHTHTAETAAKANELSEIENFLNY